ncbi:hypothetical protein BSKO_00213 [Bryopsis sp. KO-2023]|nr:hypothetical protein BSKO_00213 [Bryopsis sp. KO-2023]
MVGRGSRLARESGSKTRGGMGHGKLAAHGARRTGGAWIARRTGGAWMVGRGSEMARKSGSKTRGGMGLKRAAGIWEDAPGMRGPAVRLASVQCLEQLLTSTPQNALAGKNSDGCPDLHVFQLAAGIEGGGVGQVRAGLGFDPGKMLRQGTDGCDATARDRGVLQAGFHSFGLGAGRSVDGGNAVDRHRPRCSGCIGGQPT